MSWLDWIRLALAIGSASALIVAAVALRWRMAEMQAREWDREHRPKE